MKNLGDELKNQMAQRNWQAQYQELIGDAINDSEVKAFLSEHAEEIKDENLNRSAARIYEFVEEKKKIQNGHDSFAKGYIPHLTINHETVDVVYEPSKQKLANEAVSQFKQNFKLIDLPADIREASLADYPNRDTKGRAKAYAAANKFLESYLAKKEFAPGLYLSGNFGVGKTYLLGAIANELAQQNVGVTMVHFPSFAVDMKSSIGDNSVLDKIERLKKVPVLMIDDIGADSVSVWIRDEVLGVILQYRMQEKLTTFFTSNFSMSDLEKHLAISKNNEEPIKAQRIMQRIQFLSREVVVAGDNQRLKNQVEY
ncbi:primosomal protein DnaI [Lactobacillus sp. YT155]|uniref:primosomal protein DnaI n=1 Tax=Lactobacillus sp. YT155 TaxID=3060955 RepID=UPI00265FF376|nr:primosomal protein DnaI [Lactobacillus sp. YT155]MDO1605610.1 primosomal protein DnaI [Lactobacillus sp. YT155]